MSEGMSDDMLRAANALRCMLTAGVENSWNFLASAYYFAKQFGYEGKIKEFVDYAYPTICTCFQDVEIFTSDMSGNMDPAQKSKMTEIFGGCTETAQRAESFTFCR